MKKKRIVFGGYTFVLTCYDEGKPWTNIEVYRGGEFLDEVSCLEDDVALSTTAKSMFVDE